MSRPRLVCLVGPTASGKSALALELAAALDAEIVSADSRQVYRGLDVGTAKPSAAERARVRHHCLDLVGPDEPFDVARFRAAATAAIADAHARGKAVIVAGGTGLYVRALLSGLCPAPASPPALRDALAAEMRAVGPAALHRRLALADPLAAAHINPNDGARIGRALAVALSTGRPLSAWQAEHGFREAPYDALVIGLAWPADELATRIRTRAGVMVAAGFEARALARRGLVPDAPAFRAVGYREMLACAAGTSDLDTALAATVHATCRFAKRQRTWFRARPEVVWRHPGAERGKLLREATAFLGGSARPDVLPA
jgi:tRNA dimethylallyltransferase